MLVSPAEKIETIRASRNRSKQDIDVATRHQNVHSAGFIERREPIVVIIFAHLADSCTSEETSRLKGTPERIT